MSIVGRSERSDLRHGTQNEIRLVGGRYPRSDLQYSLFTITDVKKKCLKTLKLNKPAINLFFWNY